VGVRYFHPHSEELRKIILDKGTLPDWARKSPRIPMVGELKYMPNFAICKTKPRDIIFIVGDLGMGGCMMYSNDPHAMIIRYDDIYNIELQPKIDFEPIQFK